MDAIQKQFILKSDNPAWQYKMKESHYFYLYWGLQGNFTVKTYAVPQYFDAYSHVFDA